MKVVDTILANEEIIMLVKLNEEAISQNLLI